jgi:hypothetical protein
MALFNLQFTQRPPDDLIEIMGRILDANINSAKRREDRIPITAETSRKLNIGKDTSIFIQGVPRHCILRDISFSGIKIIMMGVAKFLVDREAVLKVDFEDPREAFLLKGKFIRAEAVEGRKELVSLVIHFDNNVVPMGYKVRINDYLSQVRPESRGNEKAAAAETQASPFSSQAAGGQNQNMNAATPVPPKQPGKADAGMNPSPPPDEAAEIAPAKAAAPADDGFDLQLP